MMMIYGRQELILSRLFQLDLQKSVGAVAQGPAGIGLTSQPAGRIIITEKHLTTRAKLTCFGYYN